MPPTAPKPAEIAVFVATIAKRTSVAPRVEAALNSNQPKSRMNVPSRAIGMLCAASVHGSRSREVHVPEAEVHAVAELGEPPATPRPGAEQREVDRATEDGPQHEALPLPPLCHRARRDGRGRVHERVHVQEERRRRRAQCRVLTDPTERSEE